MDIFRVLSRGASIKQKQKEDLKLFQPHKVSDGVPEDVNGGGINFFAPQTKVRSKQSTSKPGNAETNTESGPDRITTQSQASDYRGQRRIKVTGDASLPIASFAELGERYNVSERLLRNVARQNFDEPTPIQSEAIPALLEGHDVVACAPTGSGKTLAFVAPLIHALAAPATTDPSSASRKKKCSPRAVIVSPTRELAAQIYEVAVHLSKPGKEIVVANLTRSMIGKLRSNNAGAKQTMDLVVTTPLRLLEALKENFVSLDSVRYLILDEADRLLGDAGFVGQTDEIVASCTQPSVVKAIFSATMPSNVEELARSIMTASVVRILVGHKEAAASTIDQQLLYCGNEFGKLTAVRQMLVGGEITPPILVFVQSIQRAKALFHELIYDKVNVDVIHSELTQNQRDRVVANFKQGDVWVLICTDVLARGIDFQGVNLVINYDIPLSAQAYVHRIGRTGRAGRQGKAVTFYTREDTDNLAGVVNVMRQSGCEVSEWLAKAAGRSKHDHPIKRDEISTVPHAVRRKRREHRDMIEASKRRKTQKQ